MKENRVTKRCRRYTSCLADFLIVSGAALKEDEAGNLHHELGAGVRGRETAG